MYVSMYTASQNFNSLRIMVIVDNQTTFVTYLSTFVTYLSMTVKLLDTL